jgi:predicted nucleic acid-binding protein
VTDAVLDASVVVKWFHSEGEQHVLPARALRKQFEAGELRVLAPSLLWLEIVNVAARRWGWTETELAALARSLTDLGFEPADPDIAAVARWAARGLTAYDAAYVAVAEHAAARLITDDDEIVRAAPELSTALSAIDRPGKDARPHGPTDAA